MQRLTTRSGKVLVIVGIVAALAGVVGGLVAAPRLVKHKPAKQAAADKEKPDKKHAEKAETKTAKESEETDHEVEDEHVTVVPLGDFLVNLEAGAQVRYLRAEVALALVGLPEPEKKGGHGGGKGGPVPEGDVTVARDRVTAVLSAGSFEALRTAAAKEKLKSQVAKKLGEALPQYEIKEVLFTSFVMQ